MPHNGSRAPAFLSNSPEALAHIQETSKKAADECFDCVETLEGYDHNPSDAQRISQRGWAAEEIITRILCMLAKEGPNNLMGKVVDVWHIIAAFCVDRVRSIPPGLPLDISLVPQHCSPYNRGWQANDYQEREMFALSAYETGITTHLKMKYTIQVDFWSPDSNRRQTRTVRKGTLCYVLGGNMSVHTFNQEARQRALDEASSCDHRRKRSNPPSRVKHMRQLYVDFGDSQTYLPVDVLEIGEESARQLELGQRVVIKFSRDSFRLHSVFNAVGKVVGVLDGPDPSRFDKPFLTDQQVINDAFMRHGKDTKLPALGHRQNVYRPTGQPWFEIELEGDFRRDGDPETLVCRFDELLRLDSGHDHEKMRYQWLICKQWSAFVKRKRGQHSIGAGAGGGGA